MSQQFTDIAERLRKSSSVAVLTGAGVSAESGIPTFRDAMAGMWAEFDPAELATPEAFERNPERVTRWYDQRRVEVMSCSPNAGHVALARLQKRVIDRGGEFTIITQNVDRLHQRGGSTGVIELHGSLQTWRCVQCGEEREEAGERFAAYPPMCGCGGMRRPGVVWFRELLPDESMKAATRAAETCDFFMSLGTSSQVFPAAGLIDVAVGNEAAALEVNPEETPYSDLMKWSIRGKTGEVLPAIVAELGLD